ncbi:MAG: hypothetical protein H0X39_11360 [Actinobacteria bacterium]|nr:hypothetical protein [Actinomycetota bacterium]
MGDETGYALSGRDVDDGASPLSDEAALADDAARVARAATELGVDVPEGFFLAGVDENGQHTAFTPGTANDLRVSAAILKRLDGQSIAECLSLPEESGSKPKRMPPDDLNDAEEWQNWMAEHTHHPEWLRLYNGAEDWITILGSGVGIASIAQAAKSVMNLRTRRNFAKWLVQEAHKRGVHVDPVAVIRAFDGGAPEPGETSAGAGTQADDSEPGESGS